MQSMILFSVVACAYGGYNGGCVNNLGQGVECASATTYNGACVNSLGQGVPCRERRSAQEGQYSPAAEPYVHVEIAAEPYVHQEIPAQPYQGATGYAGPAYGGYNGGCVNNLGQGVPCRNKRSAQEGQYSPVAEPYVHVEIAAEPYVHQEIPAQPYQGATGYAGPAYGGYNGGCVNNLGQGVPCRNRRSAQEGQYSPAAEPYVHVEIAAEPYVHQEIPAQPYQGATGYAGPAYGGFNGGCVNNLGQGVPCRNKRSAQEGQYSPAAEPYVHVEIAAEPYVHQEIPAQPYQGATGYAGPAYGGYNGGCVNNLGQGVPCRN